MSIQEVVASNHSVVLHWIAISSNVVCENILIHIGRYHFTYYFSKMPHPASFIIYFQSFQTNVTHSTTVYVKKCPSSIRCRDSNPQLLGRKSPPITTRPGLLPITLLSSMRKKFIFLLGFSIIGN